MLSGKHVVLRRVEPEDHALVQRWQNDPEIFRWMDYDRPFSLEDIRRSEQRATEEGHPFVIEVDGRPIGRVGLNRFRWRDGIASMYIFIGERSEWGKGYGLDALLVLFRYGFDVLGLRMIQLWTLGDNERALHQYKVAGMVEDARLPARSFHDGTYVDHVVMSIDRDSFARTRAQHGI